MNLIEEMYSEWDKRLRAMSDEELRKLIQEFEEEKQESYTLIKRLNSNEVPSFVDVRDQESDLYSHIYDLDYDIDSIQEILRLRATGYDIVIPKGLL